MFYIGPTYRQTKLIAWREMKRMIPKDVLLKSNESELTFDLKNGSTIFLVGSDEPDSLRGPNADYAVLEEASLHKPYVWQEIVRPALTSKKGGALFIFTPKGLNWIYDLEQDVADDPEWTRYHYTIYDNPYIDPKEIEKTKALCSEMVWRQEYMAEYEAALGRVIHAFNPSKHFITLPPYSGEPMVVPIDYGQRDNTAAPFMIIRDGKLCVMDYHAQNMLAARQQAQLIKRKIEMRGYRVDRAVLSHDAFRVDPDHKGDTVAWRFIDELYPIPVSKSDRDKTARLDLLSLLASQDKLLIHKSNETLPLADEIVKLEWKDTLIEDTKGDDDGVDSLGYGAMNMRHDLSLDKSMNSGQDYDEPVSISKTGDYRLRGFEREDEGRIVFDEVTGYIGRY